jgi:2-amino-4-hydroxy-6-hydroxymethyldihydropteridine diphosphokinase
MGRALLILGSNLGDRRKNLKNAGVLLAQFAGDILKTSSIYETEPWGCDDTDFFLNRVIELETSHNPWALLSITQRIESMLGRVRGEEQYAPRTMDIDILFYDHLVIKTTELIIPHPEMHKRRFVLELMVEISPDWEHPILKQSMSALLSVCGDSKKVMPFRE